MGGDDTKLLRTFVAIDLPPALHDVVAAEQMRLRHRLAQDGLARHLSWSATGSIHLTLRFLGDTDPDQRRELASAMQVTAAAWRPFCLSISRVGAFPSLHRPRVLWLGMDGDLAELRALQEAVGKLVQHVGFAAEKRDFSPHLTLARARRGASPRDLAAVGDALRDYVPDVTPATAAIDHLIYYQSTLSPGGAVYTPLAEISFGSGSPA